MRGRRCLLAILGACLWVPSLGAQPRPQGRPSSGTRHRANPRRTAVGPPAVVPSTPVPSPIARVRRLLGFAVAQAQSGSCEGARLARDVCATLLAYAEDACRISAGEVSLGGNGAQEGALFSGPEPAPVPPGLGTAVRFCTGILRAAGGTPPAAASCGFAAGGDGDGFAVVQLATGPVTIASAEARYREGLRACGATAAVPATSMQAPGSSGPNRAREDGPSPDARPVWRLAFGLDLGALVPVVPDLYDRLYGAVGVLDLGVRVSVARWRLEAHAMGLGSPAQGTTFNGTEQRQDVYGLGARGALLVALVSRAPWEVQVGPEIGYLFLQREFARQDLPIATPERQHGHHLLVGAAVGVERRVWSPASEAGRGLSIALNVAADFVLLSVNEELTPSAQVRVTGGFRYAL